MPQRPGVRYTYPFGTGALKRAVARRSPAIALPAIPAQHAPRPAPAKKPHAWVAKLRSLAVSLRSEASEFLRLFSYTRPYRGRLLLSWLTTAGYAASGAILVSKIKPIFDEVLIQGINVGRMALVILGLYLVKGACSYISTTLVASVGQRAVTDLRNDLYQHILRQSFTFLGRNTTGSLMSHITTDVEKIQNAVSEMAGDLLKEGLTVLGLLIVLFYMDWRLAILSLVGMPLAIIPLVRLGQRLRAGNEIDHFGAGGISPRSSRKRSRASGWSRPSAWRASRSVASGARPPVSST